MTKIEIPTADAVIAVNKFICHEGGNPHHCNDSGKIESAISTAFYPGSYPFAHGGLARVAGALCFYLVKGHAFVDGNKRTGALVAVAFLNDHDLDLEYPIDLGQGVNELASIIDSWAAGTLAMQDLKEWFDAHKVEFY